MSGSPEFDVIVYGATGYTGRLVAEYFLKTCGAGKDIKWAMAGRNRDKLAEIRNLIGAPASLPLIVADAEDAAALEAMAARTKVVLTTAGPYQLYGSKLVAACARTGTDYVDLTGESHWIAAMIAAHETEAKKSGARLVFSCGFDSIPFDSVCGSSRKRRRNAWRLCAARAGPCSRHQRRPIRRHARERSGDHGARAGRSRHRRLLANPFALTPGFTGPAQPDGDTPYEDKVTGSWVGPFMMAGINTKAVHRTNRCSANLGAQRSLTTKCRCWKARRNPAAAPIWVASISISPTCPSRAKARRRHERDAGWYDILFIAEMNDGRTVRAAVKGDADPGYGSTSKILAEAALALAFDVPRSVTPGGCWTPAAAMAEPLLKRLPTKAGLTFEVER